MVSLLHSNSRSSLFGRLLVSSVILCLSFLPGHLLAHQMPNTIVLLDIKQDGVSAELQLPLNELELAFGHDVNKNPDGLVERVGPQLKDYLLQHIHPKSEDGKEWKINVLSMQVQPAEQTASGPYNEIRVQLWMTPSAGENTHNFVFNYDVILHQVVTHSALVSIRQDWESGVYNDKPVDVGVIKLNVRDNTIPPLIISQDKGNMWTGFTGMVGLGMKHISEGTDHLLFILVLLLAAPLLPAGKNWGDFGGTKYSISRLLKIVTAFTVGHSLTLFAGAVGWLRLPSQPIETLIAFSILVSAIHAIRPVFPGKEIYIAAGFGLIHGLAFAGTLTNLNLGGWYMALSILGFNVGIELMQLFVIAVTIPWIILLARTKDYTSFRIVGAGVAGIVAIAWMMERISQQSNILSDIAAKSFRFAPYLLIALAVSSLFSWYKEQSIKVKTAK